MPPNPARRSTTGGQGLASTTTFSDRCDRWLQECLAVRVAWFIGSSAMGSRGRDETGSISSLADKPILHRVAHLQNA